MDIVSAVLYVAGALLIGLGAAVRQLVLVT